MNNIIQHMILFAKGGITKPPIFLEPSLRARLAPIISFHLVEMKWNDMVISFHFVKSTEMTGYPISIKVRHEIKIHGIPNEFYNQFYGSQTSNY
jgi:hypothetical protein